MTPKNTPFINSLIQRIENVALVRTVDDHTLNMMFGGKVQLKDIRHAMRHAQLRPTRDGYVHKSFKRNGRNNTGLTLACWLITVGLGLAMAESAWPGIIGRLLS